MINQFDQLSIRTTSPQSPDKTAADDSVTIKNPKKNKKGNKKKSQDANASSAVTDSFENLTQGGKSNTTICNEISNAATAKQEAAAQFQDLQGEATEKKKSPGKSKKRKSKSKKSWENAQRYADYSTNAEDAAILASLGQYGQQGGYISYPESLPYTAGSFESSETGMLEGSIVSGVTLDEYYGTQSVAAASLYYHQPNTVACESAPCQPFHSLQNVQSEVTSYQHQQPVESAQHPDTYYMYGMPQYPMYYSCYPVMQNGMVFYPPPPQHQWDENTPPPIVYGENGSVVTVQERAKLNVDAPSFEPSKM